MADGKLQMRKWPIDKRQDTQTQLVPLPYSLDQLSRTEVEKWVVGSTKCGADCKQKRQDKTKAIHSMHASPALASKTAFSSLEDKCGRHQRTRKLFLFFMRCIDSCFNLSTTQTHTHTHNHCFSKRHRRFRCIWSQSQQKCSDRPRIHKLDVRVQTAKVSFAGSTSVCDKCCVIMFAEEPTQFSCTPFKHLSMQARTIVAILPNCVTNTKNLSQNSLTTKSVCLPSTTAVRFRVVGKPPSAIAGVRCSVIGGGASGRFRKFISSPFFFFLMEM